jgi:two-component system chemotaxis response regulator CheY
MEPLNCLVVDDDELCREILILNMAEVAVCDVATNGREALQKYSASLLAKPYDLIFLDIVMPEMDGYETAKTIRHMEQDQGITPDKGVNIIVMSSLSTPQDIVKSYISAQSVAHLVKPVKPAKLKKTLYQLGLIPELLTAG